MCGARYGEAKVQICGLRDPGFISLAPARIGEVYAKLAEYN
jgi:hypothetical protein